MHLVVETAVVSAIFRDVDHALKTPVERSVENAPLRLRPAFHGDLTQHLVPTSLRRRLRRFEAPRRNLAAQVRLRLLHADKRNAIAELERPHARRRERNPAPLAYRLHLHRHRLAEFPIDIRLHPAEALIAAHRSARLPLQAAGQPVHQHNGCLAIRKTETKGTAAFGRRELGLDQRVVKTGRVEIGRRLFLIVGCGLARPRHDAEQLLHAMRVDGQRKPLDLIIQRVSPAWVHSHHAVRQVHGGPRRLQQNAHISNRRIDILNLRRAAARQIKDPSQKSVRDPARLQNPPRLNPCNFQSTFPFKIPASNNPGVHGVPEHFKTPKSQLICLLILRSADRTTRRFPSSRRRPSEPSICRNKSDRRTAPKHSDDKIETIRSLFISINLLRKVCALLPLLFETVPAARCTLSTTARALA